MKTTPQITTKKKDKIEKVIPAIATASKIEAVDKSKHTDEMERLPLELKKSGFLNRQFKRGNKAVIYEVSDSAGIVSYDVFAIKVSLPKIAFGKQYGAYEKWPGLNAYGVWAFCYSTFAGMHTEKSLEAAVSKFNFFETENIDIPDDEDEDEDESEDEDTSDPEDDGRDKDEDLDTE